VLLIAYSLLGLAVLVGNGTLPGLPFAVAAAGLLVYAWVRGSRMVPWMLPWLVALNAVLVLTRAPAAGALFSLFAPLTILQAVLAIVAYLRPQFVGRAALAVALGLYAVTGAFVIARSPAPRIDVLELQQGGARDLEAGHNPYASTFPNPYSREQTRTFFGGERTELGEYPYPPLSLLATTLGHWIGGDVRWTLLAAQLCVALLLYELCRGARHGSSVALAIATLYLLHPRGLFTLEQAWTESLLACGFLTLVLLAQKQRTRWLGIALGLYVAVKQYSVIALPLLFEGRRLRARAWLDALTVASAITLPFFVWSPRDFVGDVVLFQLKQPFRPDSLSLPAFVASLTGWRAPGGLALIAAAAAFAGVRSRLGPSSPPSILPLSAAVVFVSFFLFAKQAFCNYFYFVGVLILAAAALLEPIGGVDRSAAA
jgi:hypothetical protein